MPPKVSDFIRTHWRLSLVVGVALVFFAFGRYSAPTKVQTKVVTVDRVVEHAVETQGETKTRVVFRDRTVIQKADGTVERRDVEREGDGDIKAETKAETKVEEHTKAAEKTVERSSPSWQVNALGGFGSDHPGKLILGAQVERRILGPIWLGAWGTNLREGGLSVGFEF